MYQIYTYITQVLAWLGTTDEEAELAIDLISEAGKPDSAGRAFIDLLSSASMEQYQAVNCFLNRSYWHWVWIIQEIALPPSIMVHYGHRSLEWNLIATFLSRLAFISMWDRNPLGDNWSGFNFKDNLPAKVSQIRDVWQGALYHGGKSLIKVIGKTLGSVCLDPRDKIYGLLALTDKVGRSLEVDYSKT
jgi:hypothetical protein